MDGDTTKKKKSKKNVVVKKAISLETFVFLAIFFLIFGLMARKMGTPLMFKTMMATAHDLLLNTVFFIMAMAVIAGAISALLSEFGAIALHIYQITRLLFHLRKIKDLPLSLKNIKCQPYVT